jgi:hypothetical protein
MKLNVCIPILTVFTALCLKVEARALDLEPRGEWRLIARRNDGTQSPSRCRYLHESKLLIEGLLDNLRRSSSSHKIILRPRIDVLGEPHPAQGPAHGDPGAPNQPGEGPAHEDPGAPNQPGEGPRSGGEPGSSSSSELGDLPAPEDLPQSSLWPHPPPKYATLYQDATNFLTKSGIDKTRFMFYDSSIVTPVVTFAKAHEYFTALDAFKGFDDPTIPERDSPADDDASMEVQYQEDEESNAEDSTWPISLSIVYAEATQGIATVMLPAEGVVKQSSYWARFEWPRLIARGITVKWLDPNRPSDSKILWQPGDDPKMAFPLNTPIANIGH